MSSLIIVKPLHAALSHTTDSLGKMDPYVVFILGDQRVKSSVCQNGGRQPTWNETITLSRVSEDNLYIEIWDENIFKDTWIACGELDITNILSAGHVDQWVPLYYKQQPAGQILLDITYQPNSVNLGNVQSCTENVANQFISASQQYNQGGQGQFSSQGQFLSGEEKKAYEHSFQTTYPQHLGMHKAHEGTQGSFVYQEPPMLKKGHEGTQDSTSYQGPNAQNQSGQYNQGNH